MVTNLIAKEVVSTVQADTMNKTYDMLRELSIEELELAIEDAPFFFIKGWNGQPCYRDMYAMECLFVWQCRETIRRKTNGIW